MKTRVATAAGLAVLLFCLGSLISCKKSEEPQPSGQVAQTTEPAPPRNPDRNAYFGEEHIHTSWSVDAWVMGNRITGPDDALKYAQGQTIKHPMGYDIKIDTPMDFMGVTDHSEYVNVTKAGEHAGFGDQQDAGSAALNSEGPQQRRGAAEGLPLSPLSHQQASDQGFYEPRSGGQRLEGKRQDRRRE